MFRSLEHIVFISIFTAIPNPNGISDLAIDVETIFICNAAMLPSIIATILFTLDTF